MNPLELTGDLTAELLTVSPPDSRSARAEAVAMLRFGGGVRVGEDGTLLLEITLNAPGAARRLATLLSREWGILPTDPSYHMLGEKVLVRRGHHAETLVRAVGLIDRWGRPVVGMPPDVVAGAAFHTAVAAGALRGAVLARRRVNIARSGVLTLIMRSEGLAEAMAVGGFVRKLGGSPLVKERRQGPEPDHVVLVRDCGGLHTLAQALGAPEFSARSVDPAAVRRTTTGRYPGLRAANRDRVIAAGKADAARARYALDVLGSTVPAEVAAAARLRIVHPEESLSELALRCDPPVSKNTLAGRLRWLMKTAERHSQTGSLSA